MYQLVPSLEHFVEFLCERFLRVAAATEGKASQIR